MSAIRSLVGVLDRDCTTFRARHCHLDGHPNHQIEQLATALYRHYDGDLTRLTSTLLRHDWYRLAADATHSDTLPTTPIRPPLEKGYVSVAGLGYHFPYARPTQPSRGWLAERPNTTYPWLYLFTATGALAVYSRDHAPRWVFHDRYTADQLRDLAASTPRPGTTR